MSDVDFPPTLAHAIHESLLRLKKDALEGNLPMFINEAAYGLDAGIRLDTESLCSRWSPTLEMLTRDEIERREGDRERQIRRLKRDTARFGGLGSFAVVEEEILSSGRRRLKRKRSTSPTGRGTPRGAASRADSPAVVDISVARATSLTDKYVLIIVRVLMIVSEGDGGVEIVWFRGRGLLQCGRDLMDLDSYVIIVGFGMLRLANYRNGEDGCMQLGRRYEILKHANTYYFSIVPI